MSRAAGPRRLMPKPSRGRTCASCQRRAFGATPVRTKQQQSGQVVRSPKTQRRAGFAAAPADAGQHCIVLKTRLGVTPRLTPKPHSGSGKERLGKVSKIGNLYIRRLFYPGAMGVIAARRRKPAGDDRQGTIGRGRSAGDDWLWQTSERKPLKLVDTPWRAARSGRCSGPGKAIGWR